MAADNKDPYFSRLPDKLVETILMLSFNDAPFYFDDCVDTLREDRHLRKNARDMAVEEGDFFIDPAQDIALPTPPWDRESLYSNESEELPIAPNKKAQNPVYSLSALRLSDATHVRDWLRVTRTSRLFRRIGKPAFWQAKTIIVRKYRSQNLAERHCGLTADDWAIALSNIRCLVVEGMIPCLPSPYVGLPRLLQPFEALQSCTISLPLYHARAWYPVPTRLDRSSHPEQADMDVPERMKDLLVSAGIGRELRLKLRYPVRRLDCALEALERWVYPMLEFRVKCLLQSRQRRQEINE